MPGPAFAPVLRRMAPEDLETLKGRLRDRLKAGAGRFVVSARANAVKGRASTPKYQ